MPAAILQGTELPLLMPTHQPAPFVPEALEERFASRRSARTPALLSHQSLPQSIPVIIRDSSSSGARLEVPDAQDSHSLDLDRLPTRLILSIPVDRAWVECEIAWRNGPLLGVRYMGLTHTRPRPTRPKAQKPSTSNLLAKLLGRNSAKGV
jgi:hypothetical protein